MVSYKALNTYFDVLQDGSNCTFMELKLYIKIKLSFKKRKF